MNDEIKEKAVILPPFEHMIMTIGELPSSYVESMTYYEMLVWFTNYLGKTVIPAINENGEAVIELQNLFVELQTYVNDYFDNLDVQEEINNKLDDMAESGQLTDIIAQYLGLAGMIAFDTVADMKLAENLVNGSKCHTLGFHSVKDGGSALYKIRTITNDDVVDEQSIIAVYDDSLIAELIPEDTVDIRQLGYINTMTASDTVSFLNNSLSKYENILIKDETLTINDDILVNNNQKIRMENSKIHNTNTNNQEYIFYLNGVSNVEITGLNAEIYFDKPSQAQQACLKIYNSSNVYFSGIDLNKAGGDGITVSGTDNETVSSNIVIDNCTINNNRRNGVALIGGVKDFVIKNCRITNTSGTNPQYGIDLETWQDDIYNENVLIERCNFSGNVGAIDIMPYNKNIRIRNCIFNSNNINSVITEAAGSNAYPKDVVIENNTFENGGIYFRGTQYAQYIIDNNTFNGKGITTETESDFTQHFSTAPKDGYLKITNNVITSSSNHGLNIGGSDNVLISGNTIENCVNRFITAANCNNLIIVQNNFMNHALNTTSPGDINAIYILTSHNIMLVGNSFIDTSVNTYSKLVRFQASCQKLIATNNNFANVSYTTLFAYDGTISNKIVDNNLTAS